MQNKLGAVILIGVSVMPGAALQQVAAASDAGPQACTTEHFQSLAGTEIHINEAMRVAESGIAPAHCSVTGYLEHGTRIGFSVALPDVWNRKYLFYGIGGFGGLLFPLDTPPLSAGISRGYATATTDTGHIGTDAAWALNNPAAVINHYETGVELAARAAKHLITAYFGAPPAYSYFEGCSAGGRQGLVEAQRFPASFDGIIAGAPAWNYSALLISFIKNGNMILESVDNWVSPGEFEEIDRVVLKQCDAIDGVKDGIVMDPRQCDLDLSSLRCKRGESDDACLTDAEVRTIQDLINPDYAKPNNGYFGFYLTGGDRESASWGWPGWFFGTKPPMPDAAGKLNFAGLLLPENEDRGRGPNQFILGEQFFRYIVMNDPDFDARSFRSSQAVSRMETKLGHILDAEDTDLGRFIRAGGKLLVWHGWADPAIPPEMSIDLYERIKNDTADLPGQPTVDQSVRLFMVPGVQHCLGGFGLTEFDTLSALEAWVENGRAPARIKAAQLVDGEPERSRPLCAYPKTARFRGSGDPDKASSFACK